MKWVPERYGVELYVLAKIDGKRAKILRRQNYPVGICDTVLYGILW